MQMSWRAHLSCTGILHLGLNACCSATTLNTEISWWGALWSRLKLMCECKICAWKTQLLNQIIMLKKDTHSKENLRETVVKISYFSQPLLTSCHIFEKSQAPALPGHFPWVRNTESGCLWDKWPQYGRALGMDCYSVSSDCLICYGSGKSPRWPFNTVLHKPIGRRIVGKKQFVVEMLMCSWFCL